MSDRGQSRGSRGRGRGFDEGRGYGGRGRGGRGRGGPPPPQHGAAPTAAPESIGRSGPEPFSDERGGRGSRRGYGRGDNFRGRGRGGHPGQVEGRGRGRGDYERRGGQGRGEPFGRGRPLTSFPPATLDERLTDGSEQALVNSFASLSVENKERLPLRSNIGTEGEEIVLHANHFPVNLPNGPYYEYKGKLEPPVQDQLEEKRVLQAAEASPEWAQAGMTGKVVYDLARDKPSKDKGEGPSQQSHGVRGKKGKGKAKQVEERQESRNLKFISSERLGLPITITFFYDSKSNEQTPSTETEYWLSLEFSKEIKFDELNRYLNGDPTSQSYDPQPMLSMFNIILAAFPNRSGGAVVLMRQTNRKIFPQIDNFRYNLGSWRNIEARKGFFMSARPTFRQLSVNLNVCAAAFLKPEQLLYYFEKFCSGNRKTFQSFVSGLRVKLQHLGYKKKLSKVATKNARQHRFSWATGEGTVEEYYKQEHEITLLRPDLPLVEAGPKTLFPIELCYVLEDQPYRGKLNAKETQAMIKAACKPPGENRGTIINQGVQEMGWPQSAPPLSGFGLSIGTQMMVVPGRVLPAAQIQYSRGSSVSVEDAKASWNLRSVTFATGAHIPSWGVLVIQDTNRDDFSGTQDGDLLQVTSEFAKMCRKCGMSGIRDQPDALALASLSQFVRGREIRNANFKQTLEKAIESMRPRPALIVVFLSDNDREVYAELKYICDVRIGVATVCIQSSNIKNPKGRAQYLANVALKVNMKMGGVNHTLQPDSTSTKWLKEEPTMLCGIDVTHPTNKEAIKGSPSIAVLVANTDDSLAQFPASMKIQESKKEMVTDLQEMMEERLAAYKNKRGVLPQRIIIFRDGVSEGQFKLVLGNELAEPEDEDSELKAVKKAFASKKFPNYKPKLTIVVCAKRHHTRFYPTKPEYGDHKGNPKPGTVVDRGVTSIFGFDFFLQAHAGLQGTTKPTHYHVIYDEIGFNSDLIQTFVKDVSWLFARATKAVSLATPAYYADLACERGRCYLQPLLEGAGAGADSQSVASSSTEGQAMRQAKDLWGEGVAANLKETMFYL